MKATRLTAVVLGALLLQVALARYAVGGRFAFDLVLVGVVFVALQSGAVGGMLAGTIGGLLHDILSGGVVGVGGLVKTLVGYAAGALGTQFFVAKAYARAVIVGLATVAHVLMHAGLRAVMDQSWPPTVSWSAMLEQVAINTVAGWVAFQMTESLPGAVSRGRSRGRSNWSRRQW